MMYNYKTLKTLPDNISFILIFEFLNTLKNASLRPGNIHDDCPPMLFWWFEKNNDEINNLIVEAVNNYPWQDKWTIENRGNNKWLLFPEHIRDGERCAKGIMEGPIEVSRVGVGWLMKNEPEFGRRANQDLDGFKKYFRKVVENYLREKENMSR